jgi:hypothetical protein
VHDSAADSEQEEILAPDEAPTPMWLPLLGVALLLLGAFYFALGSGAEPASDAAAAGARPSAAAPADEAAEPAAE